jgi:hypothetical protein
MSRLHQIRQNMSERVLDGFRLYVVNNIEAKCRTERMGFTRLFSEYLLIGWCQIRVYPKLNLATKRLQICDDEISISPLQAGSREVISAASVYRDCNLAIEIPPNNDETHRLRDQLRLTW